MTECNQTYTLLLYVLLEAIPILKRKLKCSSFTNMIGSTRKETQSSFVVEYLMKTADRGIVYKPDATKGIECLDGADLP